jgi:hypothetical protein
MRTRTKHETEAKVNTTRSDIKGEEENRTRRNKTKLRVLVALGQGNMVGW